MTVADGKIIFVNRVYWPSESASAQLLSDLASGLAARGRAVHVIAAGHGSQTHDGVMIHRTGGDVTHRGVFSQAANYGGFLHAARRALKRVITPGDVVVLMTDPPLLAAACTALAIRRGAHVVQWIQDIYPEVAVEHAGRWARPFLAPLAMTRDRAWRRADQCVVVGQDMRPALEARRVRDARILVLQNWAPREIDRAAEPTNFDATRHEWGVTDEFVVAYSGNLGRVHEFGTVLDAAEHLRDHPEIVFVVIGSGPRRAEVERDAKQRGLANLRFLPPQPRAKLAASLAAADVHLVTLRDGFQRWVNPSKLQGILASAKPVIFIGPTESFIAAFVAREGCGRHFPIGAARELANEIERLGGEPATKSAMGRAARQAYERYFSFDAALTCWDEMLRRIPG
jgi:colanic acid biosynthesis glycosyl transferase WcaI